MIFRKLSKSDLPFLLSSRSLGFLDCWTEEMFLSAFKLQNFGGLIAYEEDKDVAFITYDKSFDTADIEDVFVIPEYRKKGVANKLIENLILTLKEEGIKEVFLEVRKSNIPAINLYTKSGFNKISERKKYYSNGEDALVFKKEL